MAVDTNLELVVESESSRNSKGELKSTFHESCKRPIWYGVDRNHSSLLIGLGLPKISLAEFTSVELEKFSAKLEVVTLKAIAPTYKAPRTRQNSTTGFLNQPLRFRLEVIGRFIVS